MAVKQLEQRPWAGAIARPGQEFALTPLEIVAGKLPTGLRGSLYRNGPSRLGRGGERVGHWFDGDGAILAVHFAAGTAQATYRYVQTAGYRQEEKAGRYLFGNYGMTAPGAIWERWGKPFKNAANTSVLALPDRLLALWEAGLPHSLDLDTLETHGLDDLGALKSDPYSAHPKCDPDTGEIFNFGVGLGLNSTLHLYKSDARGRVRQRASIALEGIPLVHDFALAGDYLVFCVPPVRINPLPVVLGLASYSAAMEWQPEKGTGLYIVDRRSLKLVSRSQLPPFFQWHFANGFVGKTGELVVDLCRYEDFRSNRFLQEFATGSTHTASPAALWRLRLEVATGRLLESEVLVDRSCEFPTLDPTATGRSARCLYLNLLRRESDIGSEHFRSIGRFDYATGQLTEADLGEHRYPSEPIYAADAQQPDQGWVLTVIYDAQADASEVWIFDAAALDAPPVCRLALPAVIPHGFHGTWRAGLSPVASR
ncbi:carotenoid oxygenase family protein [Gloeobacter kilaueensis]|uniref:Carotenoid oxygenase n=1 Tax=Gloeobacter kilaueensis (strain ATCC BAA-2537 / CCAP 1431/1 / ULC 316 / JS1) TaxID=1183438 RepID=U5QNE4_GLOK1|nr:carotenoid oxygenase family protein [Gloeobacter kilaueensis]AGY60507.1 carotenoid oxygenase [Gloeobacter kilaueensis JS1]